MKSSFCSPPFDGCIHVLNGATSNRIDLFLREIIVLILEYERQFYLKGERCAAGWLLKDEFVGL